MEGQLNEDGLKVINEKYIIHNLTCRDCKKSVPDHTIEEHLEKDVSKQLPVLKYHSSGACKEMVFEKWNEKI